ncbi:1-deoxy-D-xylulose-5-phosphate synthase [Actinomyces naeslundii]|uniref:1-deoxy-D-xylulose-5-phosphate synthase n=1 Tax=Actinomyces naeslundii TaxID=1655 RepID=UPI00096DD8E1|nr:1-deoxy-D-xylulose-5-phosphate synthase [Actinomyces naeslundii]OMG26486.1 1-deoxy-D-xylulose-5-phosphate synthase [Actinomyces naeslundii]OMG28931.1 1-deoxy-D-xylulose-5-phosphate synthase [Actinomyces naeslundii]OMG29271.1 1-deoxy-D-xylulose-5-phosphate synthase [Actinomyces naeslundii]OMG34906.1 1-deoxy-D-xylulose-5-phosphate synthase [Actinomyces naeslundii]
MPAAEHTGRPAEQTSRALLASVRKPADLDRLTSEDLVALAAEIRRHLVASVARTGGHLGPNLGVVELTIALHRTFRSPRDTIVFDTGHQAYVHKLLTGRQDFAHLRERGGLSGYPSRAESVHDVVENSHASTSLSWADGIARANHLQGHDERHVVAVIGDGAMTGGMAWEALDNIADSSDRHLVIVVNDNGRSYAPTIGGLAHHLDALRTNPGYERVLSGVKRTLLSQGAPGRAAFDALHGLKRGLKDVLVPSAFFEDLGIKYTGPVDGHDITAIEFALTRAREYAEPVIVHVITEKGHGYTPAEEHVPDRFHAVGKIHPETGLPVVAERFGWTAVFAEEIVSLAQRDERIVGVTAAMQAPVGLQPLADAMPERVIDVGIAEQHALTFSAGLAFAGMHPVVALYATFLNRAFDQVLMDVALHRAGVTIVLDRAGITGTDGASHNGMWDMALLAHVPGLRLAAPRDEATLRDSLRQAVSVGDAPTVVRYPKGTLPEPLAAVRRLGLADAEKSPYDAGVEGDASSGEALGEVSAFDVVDVLLENREPADAPQLLLVGVGAMAAHAHEAGRALEQEDRAVTVVHPHWVIPPPGPLVAAAAQADVVIVVEDGLVDGGIGSQLRDAVEDYWAGRSDAAGPRVWRRIGIPRQFIDTATRDQLLEDFGMRAPDIAEAARAAADGAARAPGVRDLGAE